MNGKSTFIEPPPVGTLTITDSAGFVIASVETGPERRIGPSAHACPDELLPFAFFLLEDTWVEVLRVAAPTWFEARRYAMQTLCVGPDDLRSELLTKTDDVDVLIHWKGTESREIEVSR